MGYHHISYTVGLKAADDYAKDGAAGAGCAKGRQVNEILRHRIWKRAGGMAGEVGLADDPGAPRLSGCAGAKEIGASWMDRLVLRAGA